jgi:hypothetical protein
MIERFPLLEQAVDTSFHKFETKLSDEQILAAGLLHLRGKYDGGSEEKVQDKYIESLPPQQNSVLQMPDELMGCLPSAYQKLVRAYQDRVHDLHQSLLRCFDAEKESEREILSLLQSTSDFQWAFATVRSRCVGMDAENDSDIDERIRTGAIDTNEVRIMLPGFDLLNHKAGAQSTHHYDADQDAYILRSQETLSAGDQVFISYSDERDNLKMLMTYGFCVKENPSGLIFFDSYDLLRACAEARPRYFTYPVLQQIEGLLRKLGKHRDLYEYDGIQETPKPCLSSGIRMMEELEKQFLPSDEVDASFYQDLLDSVLAARRREALECMEQNERILQASDDNRNDNDPMLDWKPMMQSIQMLLRAEIQYIAPADIRTTE